MHGLRRPGPEIPHRNRVAQIGAGVTLLRVDEIGKLVRVPHKEDGCVVADKIPIALICINLERETTHVAFRVRGAAFARNGRETQKALALRPRLQGFGFCEGADIAGNFHSAISA